MVDPFALGGAPAFPVVAPAAVPVPPGAVDGALGGGPEPIAMLSNLPPLREGQRVRLPSGGPVMTAERVMLRPQRPYAMCIWIDRWSRTRREPFDLVTLEVVEDDAATEEET